MKQSNILGNVNSVEPLGAFDGPGIRYVLFLQGCPFRCKFCHNRDTWTTAKNKLMSVDEVLTEFNEFKHFYTRGGITVSGGEPLLQIKFLTELFKKAKEQGIHTCLDTSGATFNCLNTERFDELFKYVDLVLLDIKHIDIQKHKDLVGFSNNQVLLFADYLNKLNVRVRIRHVLLPTINSSIEDLTRLRSYIDTLSNVVGIDVLPYHKRGIDKWDKLGFNYELRDIPEPTKEEIKTAEQILTKNYNYIK